MSVSVDRRVEGKVALITGGARNQGLSHGELLARHGARVVLADVADDTGRKAAAVLAEAGLDIRYAHLDVTRPAEWATVLAMIDADYGRHDVLVNNAAILGRSGLVDCTLDEWNDVIAVNQTGVFLGMQHAIPLMRRNGSGSIINVSSAIGNLATEFNFAYSISKAAVQMLTKTAAVSLAPAIRVNTVVPGAIDTDMFSALPEETRRRRLAAYPMGRAGRIEEVSYAVLFLASDESSFTTGSELKVDGGVLAGGKQRPSS